MRAGACVITGCEQTGRDAAVALKGLRGTLRTGGDIVTVEFTDEGWEATKRLLRLAVTEPEQDSESDWYVLGAHTRRAIGYLGASLAESGDLPADYEQPRLLELWGEALTATMDVSEDSPVGTP